MEHIKVLGGIYAASWADIIAGLHRVWSPPPVETPPPEQWWIVRTLLWAFSGSSGTQEPRLLKEQHVTGLDGQPPKDIAIITILLPVLLSLRVQLPRARPSARRHALHQVLHLLEALLDFLIIVAPVVLVLLGFLPPPPTLLLASTASLLLFVLRLAVPPLRRALPRKTLHAAVQSLGQLRKASISNCRAALTLYVAISILGVDFRAFPRAFAKTERYGTSLMDVGVGMFVFVMAFSSRQARKGRPGGTVVSRLYTGTFKAAPLLLLGAVRAVAVRFLAYQTHVGEYGVHWNFFLTQGCLILLTTALGLSPGAMGVLGMGTLALHQWGLTAWGLGDIGMADHVDGESLMMQNKEGLVSLPGFWALQMLSVATGSWLIRAMEATAAASQRCLRRETEEVAPASNLVDETGASAQLGDGGAGGPSVSVQGEGASGTAASGVCDGLLALSIIARIAAVAVAFVASAAVTARLVEEVSRRTCNAAYVLWVVGASLGHVAAFLCLELIVRTEDPSGLMVSLSDNLLSVFLVANLLTGAVNIGMDTLAASDRKALGVVVAYVLAVWGFAAIMQRFRAAQVT